VSKKTTVLPRPASWLQLCDQYGVMEFGFEPVCDQLRAISTCRDSSNLLGQDSSNLVADQFAAGLSQIPLCYPGRRQVRVWSQTCHRPASSC